MDIPELVVSLKRQITFTSRTPTWLAMLDPSWLSEFGKLKVSNRSGSESDWPPNRRPTGCRNKKKEVKKKKKKQNGAKTWRLDEDPWGHSWLYSLVCSDVNGRKLTPPTPYLFCLDDDDFLCYNLFPKEWIKVGYQFYSVFENLASDTKHILTNIHFVISSLSSRLLIRFKCHKWLSCYCSY